MPTFRRRHASGARVLEWFLARRISNLVLIVVLLVPVGAVGYMVFADLEPLDALYQTMVTLSTVGYQDLATTDGGRVFTILFMIVGVGTFVIMLSSLAAFLVEGRLREVMGRRRMEREIRDLRNHIILCGIGRFGLTTAIELQGRGEVFAVVDTDPVMIEHADELGILALQADATEEESLRRMGIEHARGLISTLDSDAANVYVALTAKQMRRDLPVVTVARERNAEPKLRAAGADTVISPYAIGARALARRLLQPNVARFLAGVGGAATFQLEEIPVGAGSPLVHQTLRDSAIRQRFGATVVAILKSREETVEEHPQPDTELEAGDVLIAVGTRDALGGLANECRSPVA